MAKCECYICYKVFSNSDQRNYCLQLHPVCKSCLGKWVFKRHNYFCPVCRGRVYFYEISHLRYNRRYREFYRGIKSIRYLFDLKSYEIFSNEEGIDSLSYLFCCYSKKSWTANDKMQKNKDADCVPLQSKGDIERFERTKRII